VTPGLIDIHSHSDLTLLRDPRAVSAIHQGVTLEVVGNCGHGCFPIRDTALAPTSMYGYDEAVGIDWTQAAGYFDRLAAARPAVNVASLVPHGQLRLCAIGIAERAASSTEREVMRSALEQGLDDGAWGFSTGLEYAAERGAPEQDVAALCEVVARRGGLYATHTRQRDHGAPAAVEEAVRVAAKSGARLQVSHLVPRSGTREATECLAVIERSRDAIDVSFDMHTRLYGISYLRAALPAAALEGDAARVADRLASSEFRADLRSYRSMFSAADWGTVVLLDSDSWPEYSRQSIAVTAVARSQEPLDAVCDLLARASRRGETLTVLRMCHTEEQQREAFAHPLCMPGSDAMTLAPDGPLAGTFFHGAYSWAAWFFRFTVREARILAPQEAVRRMTGQPAARLGLPDRGVLRRGAKADITVFDPLTLTENATTFEPNQLASGVRHVLVNGTPTLVDGALTGQRNGAVLRRDRG
jgi:N-acyl-D-aspartate/D-glutamate deacylase